MMVYTNMEVMTMVRGKKTTPVKTEAPKQPEAPKETTPTEKK